MVEYEKKYLLNRNEYVFLLENLFSGKYEIKQTNHYYDSDKCFLNHMGITYRVRENDGVKCVTIKYHNQDGKEGSWEESFLINNIPTEVTYKNLALLNKGCLITVRNNNYINNGLTLSLDRNEYLNFTDFELEIEYNKSQKELAWYWENKICEMLVNGGFVKSPKEFFALKRNFSSKSNRFFKKLRELEGKHGV